MYEPTRQSIFKTYWEGMDKCLVHRSRGGWQFLGSLYKKRRRDIHCAVGKHNHREMNTSFLPKQTQIFHWRVIQNYTYHSFPSAMPSLPPKKPPTVF